MCSISGIIKYGKAPILAEMIDQLLLSLEHRGLDATGIALVNDGEIYVYKSNDSAWLFTTKKEYKNFILEKLNERTQIVLLHTRSYTKGDPRDNENNHPVFAGNCAIVHNGVIYNDDEVFKEMRLDRKAAVDSDVIRAIVDEYGLTHEAVRELENLRGSVASAIISNEEPGKVLLLRSGNPLIVAATSNEHFIFASEKHAIHVASRPWRKRFGVDMKPVRAPIDWGTFPDQSAWLMGSGGLEWHQKFKTAELLKGYGRSNATSISNKSFSTDKGIKTVIQCRNCKAWTKSRTSADKIDLDSFLCGKCGQSVDLSLG